MSSLNFANPKVALGFAAVVMGLAVVATYGADAFIPSDSAETEMVENAEVVAEEPAQQAAEADQGSPWGDGGLSDSWSSGPPAASRNRDRKNNEPDEGEDAFSDYAPESSSAPQSAGRARSSGEPTITSSAAPSAPALEPPPR